MKEIGSQNYEGTSLPKGYETPFNIPKENLAFYKQMKMWQKNNGFSKSNYNEPYNSIGTQETLLKDGWKKD